MTNKQKIMFVVILLSIAFAGNSFAWEECSWHEVGYNKTHFPNQGDWCPDGKFITQLDIDGGGYGSKNMGNYPIIKSVKCCKPKSSPKSTTSGIGVKKSALTSSDIKEIWAAIDEIKGKLGMK